MSESLHQLKLAILKEFNVTEKSFEEDVQTLQKWVCEQHHFPKIEISEYNITITLTLEKKLTDKN